MSRENVERYHRGLEAFNRRDVEALVSVADPSVKFYATFAAVGGVYEGHDGIRSWHRDLEEVFGGEIRVVPEKYFDFGEFTLGFLVQRGRGHGSGIEVAMPIAQIVQWRDDLIVYFKSYAHREDALKDLDIPEDALPEPIAL